MVKTTIEHFGKVFRIEQDGYFVDVELDGATAYFLSYLEGDEKPQVGSCSSKNAMTEALTLMGVL